MTKTRVMIDIETLGTDPGAVILSIGACEFAPGIGVVDGRTFYREIDVKSCKDAGLHVDPDTRRWWENQNAERPDGDTSLWSALAELKEHIDGANEYWANSPAFDLKLLEAAYDAVDISYPWKYYEARDVRTIRNTPAYQSLRHRGRKHHALDDAFHQAREIAATLEHMNGVVDQ